MITIVISNLTGTFAENKDIARTLRITEILPALDKRAEIVLDFTGITGATQSFIHALISEPLRKYGIASLDLIIFKNCAQSVREIIITVTEYLQESQQD